MDFFWYKYEMLEGTERAITEENHRQQRTKQGWACTVNFSTANTGTEDYGTDNTGTGTGTRVPKIKLHSRQIFELSPTHDSQLSTVK